MVEYNKIDCQLSYIQLSKFKKAVKDGSELVLRLGIKNFNKDELPHELFLTTRQSTKLRDAINHNMSTDIKFSKAQLKKFNPIRWLFRKIVKQNSWSIDESSNAIS